MLNDFCVFILSHGRPDNIYTYKTLKKHGYTGPIYIIIDNEDSTIKEYKKLYKDKVIVFDKLAVSKTVDEGDNFNDRRVILYARNACFDIAKKLGYEYFIELDDDYKYFRYKTNDKFDFVADLYVLNLNRIFEILLNFYKAIPAASIAIAQGGDFIGGEKAHKGFRLKRKCMNSFICSTKRPFKFIGRINEDVNTYTNLGARGCLFLTITLLYLYQPDTQSNKGGMTDIYLNSGTYIKSFYTVMYAPSCTKVQLMPSKYPRLHHSISWDNAVPMIIREKHKKE